MKTQRVSGGRATCAYLWLPALMLVLGIIAIIAMVLIANQSGGF
jgi:hypothetical protein